MKSLFFKIGIILALYLLIPFYFAIMQPIWSPASLSAFSFPLFWITEIGSFPYELLSCFIFLLFFAFLWRTNTLKSFIKLAILLACAIILGQAIKEGIKTTTKEPRPYVVWITQPKITQEQNTSVNYFYHLNKPERQQFIAQITQDRFDVPTWLSTHWQDETGYSFPSGHSLFALTWAFLALCLFRFKSHPIFVSLMVIFGALMEISRLQLGLHYPIDVATSAVISAIIACLTLCIAKRVSFFNDLFINSSLNS